MKIENYIGKILVRSLQRNVPEVLVATDANDLRGRLRGSAAVALDEKVSKLVADADVDDMWRGVAGYDRFRVVANICQNRLLDGGEVVMTAPDLSYSERVSECESDGVLICKIHDDWWQQKSVEVLSALRCALIDPPVHTT